MNKDKNKERTANIDQYIDSIFDKLPSNAIINKGRCGIGGTTLEIETLRDSIIVVPTIGVIDSKCSLYDGQVEKKYKSNPKIFGIKGNPSKDKLAAMLEDEHPVKKIFTTPAGLKKLMECGYYKELIMQNWFLLLDEYHTSATDAFRDDILIPFDYFWSFPKENRAMISATPCEFSDRRIPELDVYNIKITEKLGTIETLHTKSVLDCLHYFLRNTNQFDGNLHIFFNSVNEIAETLRIAHVGFNASIYIADNERNMDRLNEFKGQFISKPSSDNYRKINFYTSRYHEGWDLEDKNPTIILVTDVGIPTSKLGIRNKAFQAVGRSRNPIDRIIHITNHRDKRELLSFEEIQRQMIAKGESVIKTYNEHVNDAAAETFNIENLFKEASEKYARVDKNDNLAEYNSYLIDQLVNQEYSNQDYNHIDYIKDAWDFMNYETEDLCFDPPSIPDDFKKLKGASQVIATITAIQTLECNKDRYPLSRYDEVENELFPIGAREWFEAYYTLGLEAIERVHYSPAEIRKLMIESHNSKQESKLTEKIRGSFPRGTYPNYFVKTTLYWIYEQLGIKNLNGKPKAGKTEDLDKYFKIKPVGTLKKIAKLKYEAETGKYKKCKFTTDDETTKRGGARQAGFRVY